MSLQPVLIDGAWVAAKRSSGSFQALNPATRQPLADSYPVSTWEDVDQALDAAAACADTLRRADGETIGRFLDAFADRIAARKDELVAMANAETGLPVAPRLADVELPRTINQLKLAAAAARRRTGGRRRSTARPIFVRASLESARWRSSDRTIFLSRLAALRGETSRPRSQRATPWSKANSSSWNDPTLREEALAAAGGCGASHGHRAVALSDESCRWRTTRSGSRLGAIGYTGARSAGLVLKTAADAVGKPIYLELSSIVGRLVAL
ncbi:MAG: aldehyde dehydrogenase family protein [Pirellulaceae bacterium]